MKFLVFKKYFIYFIEVYLKRKDVLEGALNCSDVRVEQKRKAVDEYVSLHVGCAIEGSDEIVSKLFKEFQRRWQSANRKKDQFLKTNEQWFVVIVTYFFTVDYFLLLFNSLG